MRDITSINDNIEKAKEELVKAQDIVLLKKAKLNELKRKIFVDKETLIKELY